jgi:hypothetical protein
VAGHGTGNVHPLRSLELAGHAARQDARIRADWFWSTKNASTLKSVEQLMHMYYRSVGHAAVLLMNQTPDTTMRIPLTPYCKDAGVYVVEFPRTAGKDLKVQSVALVSRGQKLDKFVVRRTVRGTTQYHITITEEGSEVALEVVARLPEDASRGQATLGRRSP